MEFIPYKANECFEHLYYQIPMELFFNKNYKDKLSSNSKILYGFLLNRLTLSAKNNWIDTDGNIYLIYHIFVLNSSIFCNFFKILHFIVQVAHTFQNFI